METLFLVLFAVALTVFIAFDLSIVAALLVGLFLFSLYAKLKGNSVKAICRMIVDGAKTSKNILVVFFLVGFKGNGHTGAALFQKTAKTGVKETEIPDTQFPQ